MLRLVLSAAAVLGTVPDLVAQVYPRPVFDAPLVVLGNNTSLMIELLDHAGNGSVQALSVRIQPSATVTYLRSELRLLQTGSSVQLSSGYVPTVGTMEPVSAVGQLWAPDAAEEAVLGVGATVQIIRGWSVVQTLTANGALTGVAIGDFDGDGLGDLATLSEVGAALRELTVYRASAPNSFIATTTSLPVGSGAQLLAAETDGDGLADLVVVGGNVASYRFDGSGLQLVHDLFVGMPQPMPVAGDIDGDGDLDLVVFGETTYAVVRRVGLTAFAVESPVPGGPATHLYDVDGDGDLDGACCGGGGGSPLLAMYTPTTYRVSLNDNGVFAPAYQLHGIGGWHLAGVADIDGNGYQDLVAGRTIYFAQRSLGVPPEAGPGGSVIPKQVGDFDGDGDADCVAGPDAMHQNRGDGFHSVAGLTLLAPPPLGMTYANPMIPGDFDGDGDVDQIVEVRSAGTPVGTRLLLQRGPAYADGGEPFPADTTLSPWLGEDAFAVIVADLDGDGDLDLANNSRGPAYWSLLWYNDGAGHFASTALFGDIVLACADFTADGLPDLIVGDNRLRMRRGLANGSFAPAEPLTSTSWPYLNAFGSFNSLADSVAFADWTGDGRPDLIAGERSGASCYPVLLVNQAGAVPPFVPASGPITGINGVFPTRMLAGDVDGDGLVDAVVSNPYNASTNGCAVAFGTGGTPAFDTARTQQLLVPVTAFADLDADGDLDMIGERIVRNSQFAGATAGSSLQWGAGTAGSGGVVPLLGVAPSVAVNHVLGLRVAGVVGQTCGVLALGSSTWNVPVFGGTSYVAADVLVVLCTNGAAGTAGDGRVALLLPPLPPALAGQQFFLQGAFLDAVTGWSLTNALTLRIGH